MVQHMMSENSDNDFALSANKPCFHGSVRFSVINDHAFTAWETLSNRKQKAKKVNYKQLHKLTRQEMIVF